MQSTCVGKLSGILRIAMGLIFLWAFCDKTFGHGFATAPEKAWILGNSPTTGFLTHATSGPFAPLFQSLAGKAAVDWLFMMGLLLIGLSLVFGIGMKIAVHSGSVLLALMYLAALPPQHHPFIDDHIIYILVLQLLLQMGAEESVGLGSWWKKQKIVRKYPILA